MEKIILKDIKDKNGECSLLTAFIKDGTFIVEGYDAGETVKEFYGDWDYEYWIKVEKDQYPENIMSHIKGFSDAHKIMAWMDEQGIIYEYSSWI